MLDFDWLAGEFWPDGNKHFMAWTKLNRAGVNLTTLLIIHDLTVVAVKRVPRLAGLASPFDFGAFLPLLITYFATAKP